MAPSHRVSLGRAGEDVACRALERRGYAIVARRYRTRAGEIDIVARDGETTVFVEVKARLSEDCGSPLEAMTPRKCAQVARMARHYVAEYRLHDRPCRFDVVAVMWDRAGRASAEIVVNAFSARQ